jgi:hypothetical protein
MIGVDELRDHDLAKCTSALPPGFPSQSARRAAPRDLAREISPPFSHDSFGT